MVLNIQLREDQEQAVRDLAKQRGITADELVREAVIAFTNKVSDAEFRRHAEASVRENAELLRRLA